MCRRPSAAGPRSGEGLPKRDGELVIEEASWVHSLPLSTAPDLWPAPLWPRAVAAAAKVAPAQLPAPPSLCPALPAFCTAERMCTEV